MDWDDIKSSLNNFLQLLLFLTDSRFELYYQNGRD